MKNKIKTDKTGRAQEETSMSNASKIICLEEECIGMLNPPDHKRITDRGKIENENREHTTRSSMQFGDKGSCSNEECIGKT